MLWIFVSDVRLSCATLKRIFDKLKSLATTLQQTYRNNREHVIVGIKIQKHRNTKYSLLEEIERLPGV